MAHQVVEHVGVAADAAEHADAARALLGVDARVFQRGPGSLQHDPLLRIHELGSTRPDWPASTMSQKAGTLEAPAKRPARPTMAMPPSLDLGLAGASAAAAVSPRCLAMRAMFSTVGPSKNSATLSLRSRRLRQISRNRMASSEVPPSSKKRSWRPTLSTPISSHQVSATKRSKSPRGAA